MPRAAAVTDPIEPESPRRYRSPLREQRAAETRRALLAAAERLFVERGWFGTGMRDIAAEAGVATETLYTYFSSKSVLLHAVNDVSVVGDDQPVPLAERPEFTAMGRGTIAQRAAAAAELTAGVHERTAGIAKVLREAAPTDPDVAAMLRAARERQRADVAAGIELLLGRPPTAPERDGYWALTGPEVYLLLVQETGWTSAQYQEWLATLLEQGVRSASNNRSNNRRKTQ